MAEVDDRSHRHLRSELREDQHADPTDLGELVDGGEPPVLGPPVDDALGAHGPDAGQRLELGSAGPVEVHERRRSTCPHTTAHGVKIDQMNSVVIATADHSGQIPGSGTPQRVAGNASIGVVSSISRFSRLRPVITGSGFSSGHSGSRLSTTGMSSKL